IAVWTSLDFGAYAVLTLGFALWRWGGARPGAAKVVAFGFAAGAVPLAAYLLVRGVLWDAVRVTLFEIAPLAPVYHIGFFTMPATFANLHGFPDVLVGFLSSAGILYGSWVTAVLLVAVLIWNRSESAEVELILTLAIFTTLCGISYAQRHHLF